MLSCIAKESELMVKKKFIPLFLLSCLLNTGIAHALEVQHLEKQRLPALPVPHITVHQLKNGLTCYLLEDHEIPVVHLNAIIKVGSVYLPADKLGLASLTGDLLTSGGTKSFTPEQFEQKVDDLAIHLDSEIGAEFGSVSLSTLKESVNEGLQLFAEALFHPRFAEERVQLGKDHLLQALQSEQDDPGTYASILFHQLVYGEASPWARRANSKTIKSLQRADLERFHQDYFSPSNISLAISGDFNRGQLLSQIETLLGAEPNRKVHFPELAPVALDFQAAEQRVKRDLTQSTLRVGHLSVKRHDPDYFALQVMNAILGGGVFQNRLMQEIRVKRGLSYYVRSSFVPGTDYGEFVVSTFTKADSTDQTLNIIREEIGKMARGEGLSESELRFAKDSLVNRLIFKFESSEQIVNDYVSNRLLGYPDNYWQMYRNRVEAVSLAEVKRVATKYLHPDALKVVVLGPPRK